MEGRGGGCITPDGRVTAPHANRILIEGTREDVGLHGGRRCDARNATRILKQLSSPPARPRPAPAPPLSPTPDPPPSDATGRV